MADHIWTSEGEHVVLWDEVQVIEREHSWKERKLKEAGKIYTNGRRESIKICCCIDILIE